MGLPLAYLDLDVESFGSCGVRRAAFFLGDLWVTYCTCNLSRSTAGVEHHVQLPPSGGIVVASMNAALSEVVGHYK